MNEPTADLPPLPAPPMVWGSTSEHFKDVPTERLVREMQRWWEQGHDEEEEMAALKRGEYTATTFLVALHERADQSVFDAAAELVRSDDPDRQVEGLQILREIGHPEHRSKFPEIWNLVEPLCREETDSAVLSWALAVLSWQNFHDVYGYLVRFADHPHEDVRYTVADELLKNAPVATDPPAVNALLKLCEDEDEEVRWGALYEVKEWLIADKPELRAVIEKHVEDPDEKIRELCSRVLSGEDD